MKNDLKTELKMALQAPMPVKKREFLEKTGRSSPGICRLLILQLFHMQRSLWILNFLLLVGTVASGWMLNIWEARENMGILLLWLPFWSLLLFREELRSSLCGMEELEQSCAYCALEVLIGRLFWVGALQLLMLGVSGALLSETAEEFITVLIYFPVPWLTASFLCLLVLSVCERKQALWCCLGVTIFIGTLLLAALEMYPQIYNANYLVSWFVAAVCLAALNIVQIRKFKVRMEEGIWSLQ